MFLTEKQVKQLADKIAKQNAKKQQKTQMANKDKKDLMRDAETDRLFNEMKKLPFSD